MPLSESVVASEEAVDIEDDDLLPLPRPPVDTRTPEPTSLAAGIANFSVTVIGMPILVVSFSLAASGWVLGLAVWLVITILMGWTAVLTCRCLEYGTSDWPIVTLLDMVSGAFNSQPLSSFVWFCFMAELFGSNVSANIVVGDNLQILNPALSPLYIKLGISVIVFCLAQFLSYRLLSLTSMFGIVVCVLGVFAVPYNGFTIEPGKPGSILTPAPTSMWPPNLISATLVFGIASGAVAAHSSLPAVYLTLSQRAKRGRDVVLVASSFAFATLMYFAVGISGYLMFGNNVAEEITLDLAKLPVNVAFNKLVTVLILAIPITQYPLFLEPVRIALDVSITRYYLRRRHQQELAEQRNGQPPDSPSPTSTSEEPDETKEEKPLLETPQRRTCSSFLYDIRAPLLRIFLILSAMIISIIVPSFASLLSLAGALCSTVTAIIVPVACYLKFFWWDPPPRIRRGDPAPYRADRWEAVVGIAALVFGVALAVVGTVGTIVDMQKPP